MKTYTTIQGDCWDLIAFKIYGEEKYMKLLAEANLSLLDYLIFPPGTVINVPDIPDDSGGMKTMRTKSLTLPWKRMKKTMNHIPQ